MNITKKEIDQLNAIITIALDREDFEPKVDAVLKNYRKNANIPGFRKGQVPLSMIKKQYGDAVLFEEINKILQDELSKYIADEKLDILGNPLPVAKDVDWNADTLSFDFEIGLSPKFDIDLEKIKGITKYEVVADEKQVQEEVENIQKHFGKLVSKESVEENDDVLVAIENKEENIENETTINIGDIRTKTNQKKFLGKKSGDTVVISSKGLFEDDHKLMHVLNIPHDKVHGLDVELEFTIKEVNHKELAELNQDLFDKTFGPDQVSSEEEFKNKLKEEIEKNFNLQAGQKFNADVIDALIEQVAIEMPEEFLIKWLQNSGEKTLTTEEAKEEYKKAEKGLKYQLIENKLVKDHNLEVSLDDIKSYIKTLAIEQFGRFGRPEPTDEELDSIFKQVVSDKKEMGQVVQQITSDKLEKLFEEKIVADKKEVNDKEFIKEIYGD